MKKDAAPLVDLGLGTAPEAAPAPPVTQQPQTAPDPAATQQPQAAPTISTAPVVLPFSPAKKGLQYYPYSMSVEKMQNKMRYLANLINMNMPQLLDVSDKYNPEVAKKFNIDQYIISKIKDVSKRITKEGVPGGDGLWGPKTQEALNSIQDFAKTVINAVRPNDPSFQQFLDNMAIVAAPGKKFGGIKLSEVDANADGMTEKLDKIIELTQEFGDHLNKIGNDPSIKNQPTSDQSEQNPNQQVNQTTQSNQSTQSGQTPDAQSANQTQQQAVQNQGQKTQTVAEVKEVLQQTSQTGSLDFPFDTATDTIYFRRFTQFLLQIHNLMLKPSFISEMDTTLPALEANYVNAANALAAWTNVASGTNGIKGGFTLTVNDDVNEFVKNYAGNDYPKARNMLNVLSGLCLNLANIVRTLSTSITLNEMLGKEVFNSQYTRGLNYIDRIKNMIAQIDRNVARK